MSSTTIAIRTGIGAGGKAAEPPTYYLNFDGTNDYVDLPSGEGKEPTTAIFLEAAVLWDQALENNEHTIICRGASTTAGGYTWAIEPNTAGVMRWRFYLNGIGGAEYQLGGIRANEDKPLILAAGYDGSYYYFFVNGALAKKVAMTGTISHAASNSWTIGAISNATATWIGKGKVTMIRASNICRHTDDYTPAADLDSDANTIGLWKCTEGSGLTIADSSSHGHDGTFKGAGEPAWVEGPGLDTLASDEGLWDACLELIDNPTDVECYAHRTDADNYEVYFKVKDDEVGGSIWAKIIFERWLTGPLFMKTVYMGVPDPANDDPTSWTTDPATAVSTTVVSANEYAFQFLTANLTWSFYGGNHGHENLVSEGWTIDEEAWEPGDDEWGSGDWITYNTVSTFNDGTDDICTVTRATHFEKDNPYYRNVISFAWLATVELSSTYVGMFDYEVANILRATYELGGTDYDLTHGAGAYGNYRSPTVALWHPSNELVVAVHFPDLASVRYYGLTFNRFFHNLGEDKVYPSITAGTAISQNQAYNGQTWSTEVYYGLFAGCGDHILKNS